MVIEMLDTLICNHTCGCKLEIDRLFSCSHFIFCSDTNRKCWYCLMPFSGRTPSARNVCQLYSDTFAVCSSVPTSWARFPPVVVLLLFSWTMSSRHETDVLLYFCFNLFPLIPACTARPGLPLSPPEIAFLESPYYRPQTASTSIAITQKLSFSHLHTKR